ncbi:helix-turn-helix domain-containing protein [Brevundimonas sp. NIBR10]|uniref:helix-turn-helix domain-containing protein n=1 Tax=Brevundimonas sp. NIBR10 TaxID=3015997 RepID=UPI0022F19E2E|nr:helix-turn-helix domain-containing protein [Brevundimonas sp. NIBR10]
MTIHTPITAAPIGAATEARILAAFKDTCLLSAEATARLLGIDVRSLRALNDDGLIRAVRRGRRETRAYTEGDIRAYLTQSAAPCPSTNPPRAPTSNMTSRSGVADFMARRALKRAARPKK